MKRWVVFLIRVYQFAHTPFFRGTCRFHPTCSEFAVAAVEIHGPWKGIWLALFRLLRCQPFCRGGFDPVPEPKESSGRTQGRFA